MPSVELLNDLLGVMVGSRRRRWLCRRQHPALLHVGVRCRRRKWGRMDACHLSLRVRRLRVRGVQRVIQSCVQGRWSGAGDVRQSLSVPSPERRGNLPRTAQQDAALSAD